MSKILVTGAAGFIGSHTCLSLLENGYEVYAIDSLINGFEESIIRINNSISSKVIKKKNFLKLIT